MISMILGLSMCLTGVAAATAETAATGGVAAPAEPEAMTAADETVAGTTAAAPAVPVISKALAVDETSIRLSWGAVSGATGYYVYRGVAGGSYSFVGGTQRTYYVDTGLTKNTVYFYKIVSYYKDSNGVVTKSKMSDYKAVKMLFKPVTLMAIPEPDTTNYQDGLDSANLVMYSEKRDGIYYFTNYTLRFFSFSDSSWSVVYNDKYYYNGGEAFLTEDALYLCRYSSVKVVDLDSRSVVKEFSVTGIDTATAIGADAKGRIYIGGLKREEIVPSEDGTTGQYTYRYLLQLYSPDGTLLSSCDNGYSVARFDSFDEKTGYFVYEDIYNWLYWGYDHEGYGIRLGSVDSKNQIKQYGSDTRLLSQEIPASLDGHLDYACQIYYYDHIKNAEILGSKYIMTYSVTFGRQCLIDLNTLQYYGTMERPEFENTTGDYRDLDSIGTRSVCFEPNGTILRYAGQCMLEEINPATGERKTTIPTAHPVYSLFVSGNEIIALELDNRKYFVERLIYNAASKLTVSGETHTMKAGEEQQLSASVDNISKATLYYSSSDNSVASVTSSGKVIAWKAGKVTITVTDGKLKATYAVTVLDGSVSSVLSYRKSVSGTVDEESINYGNYNYSVYGKTVESYWNDNGNGTYTRLQYIDGNVLIEQYDAKFTKISTKTLTAPLPYFGGAFFGKNHNYLAYGQQNENEEDTRTVVRVIKYTKDWVPVSSTNIKGANTHIPFDAGSLRMTEAKGNLYVHTCHEMYGEDGYRHQANMTFVIRQSDMVMVDSYSDVMNISYGYVSHSFNQFVRADDRYLFRVDHGDAYPRGIAVTRVKLGDPITNVNYTVPLEFTDDYGYNYNYTGASIGGMELGNDVVLIAGNNINDDTDIYYEVRNVFVVLVNKETLASGGVYLSAYSSSGNKTAQTPHLVKLSDDRFLVLWSVFDYSLNRICGTEMRLLDSSGNIVEKASFGDEIKLSDCQPVCCADGLVRWYTVSSGKTDFYALNPYRLTEFVNDSKRPSSTVIRSVTTVNTGMKVTWDKADNTTAYYLYRALPGGSYSFVGGIVGTSYTDTAANEIGTTYFYKVVPYMKQNGEIIKAAASPAVAGKKTLASPTIIETVRLNDTQAKITWSKIDDARGYYVYRALPGGSYEFVGGVLSPTFTDKKLTAGKDYFYKIVAFQKKADGTEIKSAACPAVKTLATKVTMKKATSRNSYSAEVSWNALAGASGYYVYRTTAGGTYELIAETKDTGLKDTNLKYETIYYYKVVAYYISGSATLKTAMSDFASVKTK